MERWNDETIVDVVRLGEVDRLAKLLGFDEPLVPVRPSVRPLWGWTRRHDELAVWATSRGCARLLVIEGDDVPVGRLAREALRHNPTVPVLMVGVSPGEITIAFATRPERVVVRIMRVDRSRPDPIGISQLRALQLDSLAAPDLADSAEAVSRHYLESLDQEGLAREFFRGFSDALELLTSDLLDGPDEPRLRHDIALATLLRLVFLYLLQRKGALDRDPWFVIRRVRQARSRGEDLYVSCLRPLFFGLLNTPPAERDGAASALGDVPFLNGGLFEPTPAELAHPHATWPSRVWNDVFEGLLERFHFSARESSRESTRAVDPEMLGKVFEGLMFGDERSNSGSFYTPREVVSEIVEDALVTWATEMADVDRARLIALVRGDEVTFDAAERDRLLEVFSSVRILDPAVGTGAFLLEALRRLTTVRASLTGEPVDYHAMRQIIHDSLYGVDIQPTASRLCALRLWLALMTTLPQDVPLDSIPPLPNLAHRVATGNALLDAEDLFSRTVGGRRFAVETSDTAEMRAKIADLQASFLVSHGPDKAAARRRLEEAEKGLQIALAEARIGRLRRQIRPLRELAAGVDLFGEPVTLGDDQSRTLEALERALESSRDRLERIHAGHASAATFSFSTRFAEAFGTGGFDIIVTNPPWVRAHRIDTDQRALLKGRYESARNDLWPRAKSLGIRAPFGTQVDLSALFVERSLELLRPGGRLAALVPSKLLRSLHGAALRQVIARHDLERIEDFSEAKKAMFDATTYPALFMIRKTERRRRRRRMVERPMRVGVWRGDTIDRWSRPADDLGIDHPAAPWLLVDPEIEALFRTMWRNARPLGLDASLAPSRGVFTGCNDVFLRPSGEFEELLGPDAAELIRPVLAGRDLDDDGWATSAEILWLYDDQMRLASHAPESVERYFRDNAERLQGRSDHVSVLPLWQVFRVKPELLKPKVVWPDIAPCLRAEVVPRNVVPLNTTYVIPCETMDRARRVAALLNSEPVRAFAWALAERARGGFRRHFAWVIRMLPVPREFDDWSPSSADPDRWPDEVAGLFGLEPDECARLRAWRLGESVIESTDEEAA